MSMRLRTALPLDHLSGYRRLNLPGHGPLLMYFLGFQQDVRHVWLPKRFPYRYFQEKTGEDYLQIIASASVSKARAHMQPSPGRTDVLSATPEMFMASDVFQKDVVQLLLRSDLALMDVLRDAILKEYVEGGCSLGAEAGSSHV